MAVFVVDASMALAWCFEDEAAGRPDELLERLREGESLIVPAHWPVEIWNGLLVAARRKRIESELPLLYWNELARLPIEIEPALPAERASVILALCQKHGLTAYDAAYLELARRRGLPLGTLDADLAKAARAEIVTVL